MPTTVREVPAGEATTAPEVARMTYQGAVRSPVDWEHPDRCPPRGNPPVEEADLHRGEEKLSRILGW